MPIMDAKLLFSDDQAVTTSGANDSANVVDLGLLEDHLGNALDSNPGEGGGPWLNVHVTESVDNASDDATVAVKLQDSPDNSAWSDTELVVAATAQATLVAGYRMLRAKLPPGLERYLKLVYTVGGTGDLTAGKFTAWVGLESETM